MDESVGLVFEESLLEILVSRDLAILLGIGLIEKAKSPLALQPLHSGS